MDGLRTITVLEHEVIPVLGGGALASGMSETSFTGNYLSEAEADALMRLNDWRRGFCQRVSGGMKLAQHCGIVRLQTCVLEVLPKIGMSDVRTDDELISSRAALLTMLHNARQLTITKVGIVPQRAIRAPLLDIFIEAFLLSALEQARRGLLSRYVSHADDLSVVRGRFNAHHHARRNLARPHLLACDFDEFTADNPYNRAIKATLDACRTWMTRTSTQRLWFETQARFSGVSPVRMSAADVVRLPRERMTRRYEPVLTWCEWLLAMSSPSLSVGATQAPGLLFDMNKLFEDYVCGLEEKKAAGEQRIVHRQGPIEALALEGQNDAFLLKPDITVWHVASGSALLSIDRVLDAKWKRLDPHAKNWGVDQSDVYQLLAYALRYQCQRLELVYPTIDQIGESPRVGPVFEIASPALPQSSVQVQIRTVPLFV